MDQKSESGFFGSLRSHVKKTITDPSTLNKEEERAPAHGNRGGCPIITDNQISDHLFYNGHLLYSYSRILKYETSINIRPLVYLLFSCLNRLAHRKYRVLQLFARAEITSKNYRRFYWFKVWFYREHWTLIKNNKLISLRVSFT